MPIVDSELAPLRDPRLTALATSAWPAWLWSADGSRIIWANAVGAAIFGAADVSALSQRRFKTSDTSAAQVIRLGASLPSRSQERLERLRAFGAGFGRALTCVCSRIVLNDGRAAVLIVAAEPAGPALTLGERVRRLFADGADPIAAFAADGTLVFANAAARARFAGAATLSALGIADLTTLEPGSIPATARIGDTSVGVTAERLGKDNARVLLLTLAEQAPQARPVVEPVPETIPEITEQAPAAAVPEAAIAPPVEPAAEPIPTSPVLAEEPATEAVSAVRQDEPEPAFVPPDPHDEPAVDRRHPLRFVWHMDADGRFVVGSDEFIELVGPRTMAAAGRPWSEIANALNLDPDNQVARAITTQETWSGIVVSWPVDDTDERLTVELSGLPVFDRDRSFRGYRGFGVCRDIDRINELARERRERPVDVAPPQAPSQLDAVNAPPATAAAETAEDGAAPEGSAAQHDLAEPAERPAVRPALSLTPSSANVVPFRQSQPTETKTPPPLSPVERRAFRELAQELTARLRGSGPVAEDNDAEDHGAEAEPAAPRATAPAVAAPSEAAILEQTLLDRIPIGVLLYRHDSLLYANRHFLDWSGYASLEAIETSGGLNALFAGPAALPGETASLQSFSIRTRSGAELPASGRMFTVPWQGSSALALVLTSGEAEAALEKMKHALSAAESETREIKATLDTVADGIVTLDPQGLITDVNARAAALFGKSAGDMTGRALGELLAPESERAARDYHDRIVNATNSNDNAIDVAARVGENRLAPLALTITRVGSDRFAAMFSDTTARRQSEEELRNAKREATKAAAAKTEFMTEFLAKVSHEIRTPLNAITGFAEVIMAERFGPIGNERYREYVKDIHAAGSHLVALLNDLVDLSRIESGKAQLNFANISLNELTQQCVGIMQPQANKARIIIRTALTPALPHVVADERSMRQIVLNLLSNSIRLTGPGGQVIVSTVFSDAREAVLRVRDTGSGMSEKDIQAALEPFRQTATSGSLGSGGTGFGLPLTKAIAEANRANFSISSAPNAGTLVEIAFPPSRVVAE